MWLKKVIFKDMKVFFYETKSLYCISMYLNNCLFSANLFALTNGIKLEKPALESLYGDQITFSYQLC